MGELARKHAAASKLELPVQGSKGNASQPFELLEDGGLADLFIAALQLYLDPLTNLLAPDLEVSSLYMPQNPGCGNMCCSSRHLLISS